MALAAAQVIDAVAGRLAPLPATSGRVYTSRAWPIVTVPAWRIVAEDESVEAAAVEPFNLHTLDIAASGYVQASSNLDDAMHTLAASGLALLFAPTVPYGMTLTGIRRQMTEDGEAITGIVTLRLRCIYWVDPATPETILS